MVTLSRDRMSRAVKPDRARLLLTLLRLFVSSSCVIGGLQAVRPFFPGAFAPWDAARSHDIMVTLSRNRMSRAV